MKATGIVRKVDELGRIVLPKDIRRSLNLKVGTPLEIFVKENTLVLKEYSQLQNLQEKATDVCECLYKTLECDVFATDMNNVITCFGKIKSEILNEKISSLLIKIIEERKVVIHNKLNNQNKSLVLGAELNAESIIVCPIIVNSDCIGSIVCVSSNKEFSPSDAKCVSALNCLLCKNCELWS